MKKRADGAVDTSSTPTFFQSATGIAVGVGVLFLTVWAISKGWKAGQK